MNKREIQREGTLGLIYETVNQLVQEKGFDNMHIKDICERAGISTGAFYHHFSSKQDILYERYRASHEFEWALYEEARGMEIVPGLCHFIVEMTEYTRSRVPDMLTCYLEASLRMRDDWRARCGGMSLQEMLTALIAQAKEKHQLAPDIDGAAIVATIRVYLRGIMMEQCLSGGVFLETEQPEKTACALIERMCSQK